MCVAILKLMESRTEIVIVTLWLSICIHGFFVKLCSSAHSCYTIACEGSNKQNNIVFQATKRQEVTPHFPQSTLMQKFSLDTIEKFQLYSKAPSPQELLGSMLGDYSLKRRTLKYNHLNL